MKSTFRRLLSTLLELQTRRLFKQKPFLVVAVSGAVGKTTTKLAIATVLKEKFRVLVQSGSFNDEIGLPLACFGVDLPRRIYNPFAWMLRLLQMERILHSTPMYDVLVIEVGTDAPGEVPHTLSYMQPDVGVVTAVAAEHMIYFNDLDTVAAEELALVAASAKAVVSRDDVAAKYRQKYVDKHPAHYYYGLDSASDFVFDITSSTLEGGTTGTMLRRSHKLLADVSVQLYGRHLARAAMVAVAVGDLLGLTHVQLRAGVERIRPVAGRMSPLRGVNGSHIIDDSYNSSPEAVTAALQMLTSLPATGRKIALLGSMNELGAMARQYHEAAGLAASGVDLLVTVGELANDVLGPAALRAGLDPTRYKAADSPYAAGDFLKILLAPGDVLLVKGSQNGVFAEEALPVLLADQSDLSRLVRQSPFWRRKKAKQFKDGR
jgi:UDP-N-acetylmuramoyl-tripeptide--D-alanyl-D-alanine ligase